MRTTFARALAVGAIVVSLGAVAAPAASAQQQRPLGNGSLNICFVVPLPGSANLLWCL
ncbi:hypothetical protein [Speluncibacter jeojiensis]|uniref:Tripartite tricarboxylate transporter substrate binding protein n=1 Tax=Speluncibacter jeojiensis TaxID=2710754 RepID=A0A9X4RJ27_9ACTN|nr:hypothetical protein [Corynebacteriales bacterium D3-21]